MRIESLNPQNAAGVEGAGTPAAQPPQGDNSSAALGQSAVKLSRAGASPGSGLANWDPRLNQEIASAQNVYDFLGRLGDMLQSLKAEISDRLAARLPGDAKLKSDVEQFAAVWRTRNEATSSSLDGQLHYDGAGQARQRFYVRGLDMRSLQSRGSERLEFSLGGQQRGIALSIEPGMSQETILRRLNQALGVADISASVDEAGMLVFDAPQDVWDNARNTLAVKGGGIRFAAGQFNRVQVEAASDAIQPDAWQVDNATSLRSTLQEVVEATARVQEVRQMVSHAIAEAHKRFNQGTSAENREWALSFSKRFEAVASQPRYQISAAIAPAVASISRARVLSLLSLGQYR